MKIFSIAILLLASVFNAYALKPSYVVTPNNVEQLGLDVSVMVSTGTNDVSSVSVSITSKESLKIHKATLVIQSKDKLVASIPLRHVAWRTDKHWVSEFQLQSSLVDDACVILDVVPGTKPRYEINLKDWTKKSEQ
jgi:hypothetical protein